MLSRDQQGEHRPRSAEGGVLGERHIPTQATIPAMLPYVSTEAELPAAEA